MQNCPACGAAELKLRFNVHFNVGSGFDLPMAECTACTHWSLPTTAGQQRELEKEIYHHNYTGFRDDPVFVSVVREEIQRALSEAVPPPGRVLDVGCGNGAFLAEAKTAGYEVEGIDVSEAAARFVRQRGIQAHAANFLELEGEWDLITMWDVVEHLRSPAEFLTHARALLSPRGRLVLKIPGFGRANFPLIRVRNQLACQLLGAPAHVQYFNELSLAALLRRCGFTHLDWQTSRDFRTPPAGGSFVRRAKLRAYSHIRHVLDNRNLYLLAGV